MSASGPGLPLLRWRQPANTGPSIKRPPCLSTCQDVTMPCRRPIFVHIAALVFVCSNACAQPQAPALTSFTLTKSLTTVEGMLLQNGKPVPNVLLTSCGESGVVPGHKGPVKTCDRPVETRTDRDGRFRYEQMSGSATFTCYNPCAADPTSVVWFDIWKGGKPWRLFVADKGFHLSHVYLVCDFSESKGERVPMPAWPDELQRYAPLALQCKVQRWDP